jgi:hypothetical protein
MSRQRKTAGVVDSPDSDIQSIAAPFSVKPAKRKINSDLRECIQNAFYKAGGRDYLVRVAQRRPDVFLQLLAKVMPAEAHISVLHGYQALPVRVEHRDTIPAVIDAQAVPEPLRLEAPSQEIPAISAVATAIAGVDDWLN